MTDITKDAYEKLKNRVIRNEVILDNTQDDIKDIKRNLRMLMGLVFSLNSTIIGILMKGFNII